MAKNYAKLVHLIAFALIIQFVGCSGPKVDPALQKAREDTIKVFDALSAAEQEGFLITFRPTAEKTAKETFSGSELSARLAFIEKLDADLRKRKK